jgi:2-oxoglutarate ferredoxin oxidoreductase subunit beta
MSISYEDYLKKEKLPLFWCAGCGDGIVLQSLLRAFEGLCLEPQNIVVVTGIGCWGKADDYINTNTFHGTHGRALAFATGIKLANPKLNVIVLMGDGDGVTIGGNHFIHTARRNVDLTAILVNNYNYGMTGGQYSGTTPENSYTTTSAYGHIENNFDVCALATAAGAPYVARGTVYNPNQLETFIKEGIQKEGFAIIEAIAPCPTHYGKLNRMKTASEMMYWIKNNSVSIKQAEKLSTEDLKGKFVVGKFVDRNEIDYGKKYQRIIEMCNSAGGNSNE